MSTRYNTERGGKKAKGYGGGGSLGRHGRSGVAHNHRNSIERVREFNKEQERVAEIRKKQKPPLYSSVAEVFKKK